MLDTGWLARPFQVVEIKGVGMLTAAVIIGEIGDLSRFQYPRQIMKLAGLSLRKKVRASTKKIPLQ